MNERQLDKWSWLHHQVAGAGQEQRAKFAYEINKTLGSTLTTKQEHAFLPNITSDFISFGNQRWLSITILSYLKMTPEHWDMILSSSLFWMRLTPWTHLISLNVDIFFHFAYFFAFLLSLSHLMKGTSAWYSLQTVADSEVYRNCMHHKENDIRALSVWLRDSLCSLHIIHFPLCSTNAR